MVNWNITSYLNLGISIGLFSLLMLFLYQLGKKKRKVPELIVGLIFGTIGATIALIESLGLVESDPFLRAALLPIHLICYGLLIFFFYLFLESILTVQINIPRFLIAFSLLFLQIIADILIIWFDSNAVTQNIWLLADIGYDSLGIYTFLFVGLLVYVRSYQYTKEKKTIILSVAILIIGLGYVVLSLNDYTGYFGVTPDWISDISVLGDVLPFTGILLLLITYLSDVNYIYNFPFDNYVLMVAYKYGIQIHSVYFKTKKEVDLDVHLVSGFLSSLNTIFGSILGKEDVIEHISGKKTHIISENGEYISATVISEKINKYLKRSLRRYVREFEERYRSELKENLSEISHFNNAIEMISPIFPFLKPKNVPTKLNSK
ncbi:MAG: hypothetical protein ACTSQP_19030 [Promethearchaeota archaeon]